MSNDNKKKKRLLAIFIPLSLGTIAAAITVPTVMVLNAKSPDPVDPQPEPFTGETFKFDGTTLLGFNDGVTDEIIKQRFPDGKLWIPECNEIASSAFNQKIPSFINELVLPSNTTIINDNAFANNESISKISFYEGKDIDSWQLTKLGAKVFYNTSISNFTFPFKLNYIGDECFNKCSKLSYLDLTLHSSCSGIYIGENSFGNLSKTGLIYVRQGTTDSWKISLASAGLINIEKQEQIFSDLWEVKEFTCLDIDDNGTCYGFRDDIPSYLQFLIEEESKELLIPNTVKHISNSKGGFKNNEFINKLIISSSVIDIDDNCFDGCKNLNIIDVTSYKTVPQWTGKNIFNSCHEKGQVEVLNKIKETWKELFELKSGLKIDDNHWKVGRNEFDLENCVGICATEDSHIKRIALDIDDIQYSFGTSGEWQQLPEELDIPQNTTLYLKGDNPKGLSKATSGVYSRVIITGKVSLGGSIMGLISNGYDPTNTIPNEQCFLCFFQKSVGIYEVAPGFLPATVLKANCYERMFSRCSSLVQAPDLPANDLCENCYNLMFTECSSLTTSPKLPATNLAPYCYSSMFEASGLETMPDLPAQDLQNNCYGRMFYTCTHLTNASSLPAMNLAKCCYHSMFSFCTSLETAPELCATQQAEKCYCNMFNYCTKLKYLKVNFTQWDETNTSTWLSSDSTGQFICPTSLPDIEKANRSVNNVPETWTIQKV